MLSARGCGALLPSVVRLGAIIATPAKADDLAEAMAAVPQELDTATSSRDAAERNWNRFLIRMQTGNLNMLWRIFFLMAAVAGRQRLRRRC